MENLPLYHLFKQLQQNENFWVGIDDYTVFLELMMHEVQSQELNYLLSKTKILQLCKLLWFKPHQNERLFEQFFEESWKITIFTQEDLNPQPPIEEKPPIDEPTPPNDKNDDQNQRPDKVEPKDDNKNNNQNKEDSRLEKPDPNTKIYLSTAEQGKTDQPIGKPKDDNKKYFHFVKNYVPFQKRNIGQVWRFLQRPQEIGWSDEIDIPKTIESIYRKGYLEKPMLKAKRQNTAQLITFIEHQGGMVAFKNLAIALANSAKESAGIDNRIYFFQTIPHQITIDQRFDYCLYTNPSETDFEFLADIMSKKGKKTPVLIISEAGAVSNYLDVERLAKTEKFLAELRVYTPKIAWLNPMPDDRWAGNSAQKIAEMLPMYEANIAGLKKALKILRGKNQQ
jgi:uncharacterized protein with von Willebrand factor type A (vWA) domain